jgi:hypothetical protein
VPSSHAGQVNEILELIIESNPQTLLDVGVGLGKYGFLAREYLELWGHGHSSAWRGREGWRRRIDGIEAHGQYLTPVHSYIYDQVHVGNALEVLPRLKEKYDLLLLIDVLEHFERDDGIRLLSHCRESARNIIISTPKDIGDQHESWGNPFETHRHQWTRSELADDDTLFVPNPESLICYLGASDSRFRYAIRRSIVRRQIPWFLLGPYHSLKRALTSRA